MSFGTMLAYVDASDEQTNHDELSARFAAPTNSFLIGLSALAPRPPMAIEGVIIDRSIDDQDKTLKDRLAARRSRFRAATDAHHKKVEWRSKLGWPTDLVIEQSVFADVIIIGRSANDSSYTTPDIGRVVLAAGRPVLIAPPGANTLRAKSIVIGWKNTREARRAVSDALPLFHDAVRITAISICEPDQKADAVAQLQHVAQFLASHRIKCECSAVLRSGLRSGSTDAEQLTQLAINEDAGLIVSGAYGHSRLGEWIFGGMIPALTD